ncbi:hypothetical protein [Furfurilactobacillus entadae]|uniref:hypothetical protein n=1 Tax=Furfurilactobacillus entadae TaxID=2922307 RepID=UPI0035E7EA20
MNNDAGTTRYEQAFKLIQELEEFNTVEASWADLIGDDVNGRFVKPVVELRDRDGRPFSPQKQQWLREARQKLLMIRELLGVDQGAQTTSPMRLNRQYARALRAFDLSLDAIEKIMNVDRSYLRWKLKIGDCPRSEDYDVLLHWQRVPLVSDRQFMKG